MFHVEQFNEKLGNASVYRGLVTSTPTFKGFKRGNFEGYNWV